MPDQTTEVPEVAIEAAAKAQYELDGVTINGDRYSIQDWSSASEKEGDEYRGDAREVLEAVAPLLTAPLREELDKAKSDLRVAECGVAFGKVATKERDLERHKALKAEAEVEALRKRADSVEARCRELKDQMDRMRGELNLANDRATSRGSAERRLEEARGALKHAREVVGATTRTADDDIRLLDHIAATLQDSQVDGEGAKPNPWRMDAVCTCGHERRWHAEVSEGPGKGPCENNPGCDCGAFALDTTLYQPFAVPGAASTSTPEDAHELEPSLDDLPLPGPGSRHAYPTPEQPEEPRVEQPPTGFRYVATRGQLATESEGEQPEESTCGCEERFKDAMVRCLDEEFRRQASGTTPVNNYQLGFDGGIKEVKKLLRHPNVKLLPDCSTQEAGGEEVTLTGDERKALDDLIELLRSERDSRLTREQSREKLGPVVSRLERIRDLDEELSDGSLGSIAHDALDELDAAFGDDR